MNVNKTVISAEGLLRGTQITPQFSVPLASDEKHIHYDTITQSATAKGNRMLYQRLPYEAA